MRLTALLLLLAACGSAEVDEGITAFDAGDLPAAVEAFEAVGASSSATMHYNAGVARYRQDDVPRAIAHWRAASQLAPRSSDVAHNLALARARLKGAAGEPVPAQAGWLAFATAGELGLLAVLLLAAGSAGGWYWRRRDRHGAAAISAGILGALLAVVSLSAASRLRDEPIAVIVDAPAVVRDAAAVHGAELFELPPGAELQVDKAMGDFLLIRTGDERGGWIPRDSAVLVGPGYPTADQES